MTMKELRQAVPVYINGPSNGLCETTYLFDNEPEELGAQQQQHSSAALQPACTATQQQHSNTAATSARPHTPNLLSFSHPGVYTMNAVVAETPEEERSKLNLRVKDLLALPD